MKYLNRLRGQFYADGSLSASDLKNLLLGAAGSSAKMCRNPLCLLAQGGADPPEIVLLFARVRPCSKADTDDILLSRTTQTAQWDRQAILTHS